MATTYDPAALESSPRDYARFLLSDTASPWLFQDEEIDSMIALFPPPEGFAQLADAAYLRMAAKGDEWGDGDTKESYKERAKAYKELAAKIRSGAIPAVFGGTTNRPATGAMAEPDLSTFITD